jgi:hypothetical protein
MKQVTRFGLCSAIFLAGIVPAMSAFAGKSDYQLLINNETLMPMTITNTGSGCTDWDINPATVTLQAKQSTSYYYHRASRCSGLNGQVYFSFAPEFLNGSAMSVGGISSDFTADHEQTSQVTHQGSQFSVVNFQPYASGDQDLLTVNLYDAQQLDIPTALSLGFIDSGTAKSVVANLASLGDVGSNTQTAITTYSPGLDVTSYMVTVPIWGFRTLKYEDLESGWLKAGVMPSYALRALQGSRLANFWNLNGPQVSDATSDTARGMRLLAVSSSSVPSSQFASVGLDYATAADPNWHTAGQYVYAFQVIPNAPIQGVSSDPEKTGEKQVQILGGTPTNELYRSNDGVTWTVWNSSAMTWDTTSVVPSNNLQSSGVKSGLKAKRPSMLHAPKRKQ